MVRTPPSRSPRSMPRARTPDAAFHWLDRAVEQKDTGVMGLDLSSLLLAYRDDPRYLPSRQDRAGPGECAGAAGELSSDAVSRGTITHVGASVSAFSAGSGPWSEPHRARSASWRVSGFGLIEDIPNTEVWCPGSALSCQQSRRKQCRSCS